jgi:hypothetical protein
VPQLMTVDEAIAALAGLVEIEELDPDEYAVQMGCLNRWKAECLQDLWTAHTTRLARLQRRYWDRHAALAGALGQWRLSHPDLEEDTNGPERSDT